ncbi:MAG TPA: UDP-N-acetylglucosamine 2-epimerase [Phycisphaerae bacterium]|nr:UDP-N-acetylglucosamine 2-epimerase [Phycisphaerae bacterium]
MASSRRNIAILTGTRAEFGIWTPILHALQQSKILRLQLIVTGMHLQPQFGYTIRDVEASGIPIEAVVDMYRPDDLPAASLGRAVTRLGAELAALQPDLLLLLGDRLEMLAAANAALTSHIPIAHLHGGETAPGTWDEQIRHALTKLAHLHFPATKRAAQRIQQMGEDPRTIHTIGAPALDTLQRFLAGAMPCGAGAPLGMPVALSLLKKNALLLLHPSSPNDDLEQTRTSLLLRALRAANIPFTAIGPNNDPGHAGILRAYKEMGLERSVVMSLSQPNFWQLLTHASLLIGNSSAGIIEAASFALPVINLGDRQKGRQRNPNVLDIPWSAGKKGIQSAIHFALTNKPFRKKIAQRKNLYGDGHAAERLVRILEGLPYPIPTAKSFHDLPSR